MQINVFLIVFILFRFHTRLFLLSSFPILIACKANNNCTTAVPSVFSSLLFSSLFFSSLLFPFLLYFSFLFAYLYFFCFSLISLFHAHLCRHQSLRPFNTTSSTSSRASSKHKEATQQYVAPPCASAPIIQAWQRILRITKSFLNSKSDEKLSSNHAML